MLKLLLSQALDVVVINSRLNQAVGILTEMRVHLGEPVGHIVWVTHGVVCVCLQHTQVPQKPAG